MNRYRLRQVVLMADDRTIVTSQLHAMLGVEVSYNDPTLGAYGLINAVMPAGSDFIEVVQPVTADAPGRRFIDRRGGDAGYMVILQAQDADAYGRRIVAKGVRVIDRLEYEDHLAIQFHPKDFGGTLASVDEALGAAEWLSPDCHWGPAGKDWIAFRNDQTAGFAAVALQHPDPEAAAARWADLLELPLQRRADGPSLPLVGARIDFLPARGGAEDGVVGLEVRTPDPAAALERARAAGLPVESGAAMIAGVAIRPVPA